MSLVWITVGGFRKSRIPKTPLNRLSYCTRREKEKRDRMRQKGEWSIYDRARHYGISKEQFLGFLEEQDNKCGACGIEFFALSDVNVDHDHSTGVVRGLLCQNCNRGLGSFGDSVDRLRKAIVYLQKCQARVVKI